MGMYRYNIDEVKGNVYDGNTVDRVLDDIENDINNIIEEIKNDEGYTMEEVLYELEKLSKDLY